MVNEHEFLSVLSGRMNERGPLGGLSRKRSIENDMMILVDGNVTKSCTLGGRKNGKTE